MVMSRFARALYTLGALSSVACTKNIINPADGEQTVPSVMTAVAGNNQTGAPAQALSIPPAVRVSTSEGRPVKDVSVVFEARGGGSVSDPVVRTDANGVAVAGKWILGPNPGQQTLSATLPGVTTVTFVATAVGSGNVTPDRVLIGLRPYGVTVAPNGLVYTSQLDGRSVTRVQVGSTTPSGIVTVGEVPTDVTFDPTGMLALVTNQFDPSVGIIDVASGKQIQVIKGSATMFRVLVAPNGQRAYATESDGKLLVIDLSSRTLVTTVAIPNDANGLAFGAGDSLLYVTSMRGALATVNLKTNTAVRTWSLGGLLQDVAVSPDGGTLYVAHEENGAIDVVNSTTGAVANQIVTGSGVFGLKLALDGKSLYATQPSGKILVIDRLTRQISRTFSVGGIPRRIAFDRTTGRVVVSNESGWLDYLTAP
jgi:DNA-binding beta-propeller fold protein YncE